MRQVSTEGDARGRPRVITPIVGESMTVQSDAHLADITNILAQYGVTGMESLNEAELEYADVSEFGDYADVMRQMAEAETAFLKLPSKVREVFGHDVAVWLDSAHDQEKRDALVAAGFLEAEIIGEPPKVVEKVVEDPPEPKPGDQGSE